MFLFSSLAGTRPERFIFCLFYHTTQLLVFYQTAPPLDRAMVPALPIHVPFPLETLPLELLGAVGVPRFKFSGHRRGFLFFFTGAASVFLVF